MKEHKKRELFPCLDTRKKGGNFEFPASVMTGLDLIEVKQIAVKTHNKLQDFT